VPAEVIWVLPACFALVDWYAVAHDDRRTETWAKPLVLSSLIVAAVVLGATGTTAGIWLLAALVFGLLGDVALLSDTLPRFRAGVGAFLVGHLAYVVCFVSLGLPMPTWSWVGLAVLAAALFATRGVVPATHRLEGPALSVPVAVYSVVIGAMLLLAWFTGEPLVALGASVFVVSDAILSTDRFVRPIPHARLILMVTYHVGQALIVAGVLAAGG
jgi:uncharacterized membrane protein YhhN